MKEINNIRYWRMDEKQARNNFKLTKLLHGIIIVYYPDSSHASLEREKNLYFSTCNRYPGTV